MYTWNGSYFASSMVNTVPSVAMLPIDKRFSHGYDISRPSSSDQSISDALPNKIDNKNISAPNNRKTRERKLEKKLDLPVWVESEGYASAAEDAANGVRPLNFEFVFLVRWWVPYRDQ